MTRPERDIDEREALEHPAHVLGVVLVHLAPACSRVISARLESAAAARVTGSPTVGQSPL